VRKTYVYDRYQKKMVEKGTQTTENRAFHLIPDIEPYQVVGPEYGKVISSRSKHREYLKTHGLIEIGDQKPSWMTKSKMK
jgi:hypothetical protein